MINSTRHDDEFYDTLLTFSHSSNLYLFFACVKIIERCFLLSTHIKTHMKGQNQQLACTDFSIKNDYDITDI